jgi:hypothetical protein
MEQPGRRGKVTKRSYEFSLIPDLAPDYLGLPYRWILGYGFGQIGKAVKTSAYRFSVFGILGINIGQDLPN